MKLKSLLKPRIRCRGVVYVEPRRVRWVSAEFDRSETLGEIHFGESARELQPENPPTLNEILPEERQAGETRWKVVAPVPARARVLETPTLSEQELRDGLKWQTEVHFPAQDGQWTVDHEVLDPASSKDTQSVLLLGVDSAGIGTWIDWIDRDESMIEALTTPFPALIHGVQQVWKGSTDSRVLIYEDSHFAAILITVRGRIVHWRSLCQKGKTDRRAPLPRDEGVARLRESLLFCEDHFPEVSFRHLFGAGELRGEWLNEVALALDLEVGTWPTAEPGWPTPEEWLVPLGELIGG